ncbi:MAG: isochorismate synthase, partial [Candidatus Omnitrophica bacterium]|nr:isochorismate synthase [Candidatus Omnitrophota bacterium]
HNQEEETKVYWSNRDNTFETAGIGQATTLSQKDRQIIFETMEDSLSPDNARLRYFGGMAFNPPVNDPEWANFHDNQFLIPQFELHKEHQKHTFAVNIPLKNIHEECIIQLLKQLNQINFSTQTQYRTPPKVQSRHNYPEQEEWNNLFTQTINRIAEKKLSKAVLARKSVFQFDKAINPVALLKHLKDVTPNCYHFCFQTEFYQGFIGASPERLYKRQGRSIKTEALAGTKPRGKTPEEDKQLERELLSSSKNAVEHQFVVTDIQETLNQICEHFESAEKPALLKLKGYQHLITKFHGTLKENVSDHHIITAIHPTPAVGGLPQKDALDFIKAVEPFDRGWYAGAVGYVGYDHTEFSVAIRCALIQKENLSLYAGAGIVEDSTADDEWNEIEGKISNFIKVFDQ